MSLTCGTKVEIGNPEDQLDTGGSEDKGRAGGKEEPNGAKRMEG